MQLYLLIGLGSVLGGCARFFISGLVANWFGSAFPWGTLIINITGSFAIGFINAFTGTEGGFFATAATRQFLMTGICGGYTTFSSFSLQTLILATENEWLRAGANVLLSVTFCLLAVWLGHVAAHALILKGT